MCKCNECNCNVLKFNETTGEIFYRLLSNPYFFEVLFKKDIELYGFEHDRLNDNQLRLLLNETEKELNK